MQYLICVSEGGRVCGKGLTSDVMPLEASIQAIILEYLVTDPFHQDSGCILVPAWLTRFAFFLKNLSDISHVTREFRGCHDGFTNLDKGTQRKETVSNYLTLYDNR